MKTRHAAHAKTHRPLLAADIGNSTLALGLFPSPENAHEVRVARIDHCTCTSRSALKAEIRRFLAGSADEGIRVIIASVVPKATAALIQALSPWCADPRVLDHAMAPALLRGLPHPEHIGADRIANAAAAWHLTGLPTAVTDFGTATTITVVGSGPRLLGGAILPGLDLMNRALAGGTAKLPPIPLEAPSVALAKETIGAIQSGILLGSAGAVETLLRRFEDELGTELSIIVTGGHGELMSSLIGRKHMLHPVLTLLGLHVLYQKRSPQ
jgi:type III pantothenate kinase